MKIIVEYSAAICAAVTQYGFEQGCSWWVIDRTTDVILIIKPVASAQHRINRNARILFPHPDASPQTSILFPSSYMMDIWDLGIPAALHPSWGVMFIAELRRNDPSGGLAPFYRVNYTLTRNRSSSRQVGMWRYIPADDMPQFCEEAAKYLCDFFANAGAEIYAV